MYTIRGEVCFFFTEKEKKNYKHNLNYKYRVRMRKPYYIQIRILSFEYSTGNENKITKKYKRHLEKDKRNYYFSGRNFQK